MTILLLFAVGIIVWYLYLHFKPPAIRPEGTLVFLEIERMVRA